MPTEPSKYASNQFLIVTVGTFPLMGEIMAFTKPRLLAAAAAEPAFDGVVDLFTDAEQDWSAGETALTNAEATQLAGTLLLEDKLASLTRKPDADTNSPLESWDTTIRGVVAYQVGTYTVLLPQGRATLTEGTLEEQLDALKAFGVRLSQQTAKPVLVTLGTTVAAFYTAARALRDAQEEALTSVAALRDVQEKNRVACAQALYAMVGFAMFQWRLTPERVDSLISLSLLRGPAQVVPEAPGATTWTLATRTLSTALLPTGATRLEAWRLAPGGAPEQLALGETDAALVVIPAGITFTPGTAYQLWLVGRNSRGSSTPGPVTLWTA